MMKIQQVYYIHSPHIVEEGLMMSGDVVSKR